MVYYGMTYSVRFTAAGIVVTHIPTPQTHDCVYVEGQWWVRPAGTMGFMTYAMTCTTCGHEQVTVKQQRKNAKNYRNSANRYRRTH